MKRWGLTLVVAVILIVKALSLAVWSELLTLYCLIFLLYDSRNFI
jgi:hypothetical protein